MKKTVILFVILIIWLVAADLGARLLIPIQTPFAHESTLGESSLLYDPLEYASLAALPAQTVNVPGSDSGFELTTNTHGFRNDALKLGKPANTVRILVLGDSFAFGWGVDQSQTFAALLQDRLRPPEGTTVQVINAGMPESTSFQWLKRYERQLHRLQADWLILAVGPYDDFYARVSDPEVFRILEEHDSVTKPTGLSAFLSYHSFLGGTWMRQSRESARLAITILSEQRMAAEEWVRRCPPDISRQAINAILDHHESQGGQSILVDSNLVRFASGDRLQDIAERRDTPLLRLRPLVDRTAGRFERQYAFDAGLEASTFSQSETGTSILRFRVLAPPAHDAPLYISGTHPDLGDGFPERVPMRDDGEQGDEQAGDGVWTCEINTTFNEPIRFRFSSGTEPEWEPEDTGYNHDSYNRIHEFSVSPPMWTSGVEWYSIVYRYATPPFDHLVIPGSDSIPGPLLHQTIATRLNSLIRF